MSLDAIKKSFDSAGEIQWWAVFAVATALAYMGAIDGEHWALAIGGSKIIERVLNARRDKGAQ